MALLIAIAACLVLSRGTFRSPESKNFFYFKFHRLWNKLLTLAGLKGMVQGFLVTAPAILIMKFIGGEGSLGLIQGIGGALTAILVYVLGRVSRPEDRMKIFGFGLIVFFAGTLCSGIIFSAIGVIIFINYTSSALLIWNGIFIIGLKICFVFKFGKFTCHAEGAFPVIVILWTNNTQWDIITFEAL